MVRGLRHTRRTDAARTVEGGEDLVEPHHNAADGGTLLHQQHIETLLAKIEGGLHPRDPPTDYHGIVSFTDLSH